MQEEEKNKVTRRGFLNFAWGATFLIAIGEMLGITVGFLWPRLKKKRIEKIVLASVSDIPVGEGLINAEEGVIVTHPESGILVLSTTCTHLGCKVKWDAKEKNIKCPCHGAKFSLKGEVLAGPPPRPLDRIDFTIAAGKIYIKKEI